MTKLELVKNLDFGARVAEDETKMLDSYFLQTIVWERLENDEIDIVIGSKGAGKSALFAKLLNYNKVKSKGVLVIAGENITGEPLFEAIDEKELTDGKTSKWLLEQSGTAYFDILERKLVRVWKIYFLVLVTNELKRLKYYDADIKKHLKSIESFGKLSNNASLKSIFEKAINIELKLGGFEFKVQNDGISNERDNTLRHIDVNAIFKSINDYFDKKGRSIWIVLDRLDAAFDRNPTFKISFLRSLLKVYLDLKPYTGIKLKLFLKDDIWEKVSSNASQRGFPEFSHITKYATIQWKEMLLFNLVMKRMLENSSFVDFFQLNKDELLKDFNAQNKFFDKLFPPEVSNGDLSQSAFSWVYEKLKDGNGKVFPREVIHFFQELKLKQRELLTIGNTNFDSDEQLFSFSALEDALSEVSSTKLTQSVYPEYPRLQPNIILLNGLKEDISIRELAQSLYLVDVDKENEERDYRKAVIDIATKLCEVGILTQKGSGDGVYFSVGNIYKPVLKIEVSAHNTGQSKP